MTPRFPAAYQIPFFSAVSNNCFVSIKALFLKYSISDGDTLEAKQWLECVIDPAKEPLVRPEQALIVTKILEAIYQSSTTGKEVYL